MGRVNSDAPPVGKPRHATARWLTFAAPPFIQTGSRPGLPVRAVTT
jgi:hypothetical protein